MILFLNQLKAQSLFMELPSLGKADKSPYLRKEQHIKNSAHCLILKTKFVNYYIKM